MKFLRQSRVPLLLTQTYDLRRRQTLPTLYQARDWPDEQRPPKTGGKQSTDVVPAASSNSVDPARSMTQPIYGSSMPPPAATAWPMSVPSSAYLYEPETLGNEFSVLTDFLETPDEVSFFATSLAVTPSLMPTPTFSQPTPYISNSASAAEATSNPPAHPPEAPAEEPAQP
ncbi:hypothetical protein CY34DRAFT_19326 [Suillus luteus UH-Slu-Lm8-n1]|uniref:Uncharacterized protein n=1 Tax=Suillus luteus UH-Slu-Lm8-n1 TaxID=930992 RepID=A0A0C9ZRZ8_9AGAM|nr:hypothetical protein CY34DRAFT_19326 [Suillus luteus UH-Slu-Lm8-n1]